MSLPFDPHRSQGNVLPYADPQAPPRWRWLLFMAGFGVGCVAVVAVGVGLVLVYKVGPPPLMFYVLFAVILGTVAAGNVVLERRFIKSRGYGVGLLLSLSLNALCFGLCAADNFRVGIVG